MTARRLCLRSIVTLVLTVTACGSNSVSPWDQHGDPYQTQRIADVVSDESQMIAWFNSTYDALTDCEDAYSTGSAAELAFQEQTEQIAAAEGISPEDAYDRSLGAFLAAAEWLSQNGCQQRLISVG
jgi:hypothetical protein